MIEPDGLSAFPSRDWKRAGFVVAASPAAVIFKNSLRVPTVESPLQDDSKDKNLMTVKSVLEAGSCQSLHSLTCPCCGWENGGNFHGGYVSVNLGRAIDSVRRVFRLC